MEIIGVKIVQCHDTQKLVNRLNMKEGESSSLELEKGGRRGQIVPQEVSKDYFRDKFHAGLLSPHHPIFLEQGTCSKSCQRQELTRAPLSHGISCL